VTALAIAIVVVLVVANIGNKKSSRPDITELTSEMLVDRSSFPAMDDAQWSSVVTPSTSTSNPVETRPPECAPIVAEIHATQGGEASLASTAAALSLHLLVTPDRPDLKGIIPKCGTIINARYAGAVTTMPRNLAGLPQWASALDMTSPTSTSLMAIGLYRGVLIRCYYAGNGGETSSSEFANAIVKIFNDQVAKLEAA
jgi:hypothetical protein